jgi:hypothetical protein
MTTTSTSRPLPRRRAGAGSSAGTRRSRCSPRSRAVAVLAIGMVALYINNEIGDIPRVQISVPEKDRPAAPTGKYAKSMNILLAGADNGDDQGDSIAETVAKGAWRPGVHRSDTIMVLHLTSDRKARLPDLRAARHLHQTSTATASRRSTPPSPSAARRSTCGPWSSSAACA